MTKTQWMFEFHALKKKEDDQFKLQFETFRQILVSVMGLDMIRPKDENGIPKQYEDMTAEERTAFIPLVAWCGRPDMLKPVAEQAEMDMALDKVISPDDAYEQMVQAIDAADGDMEPIIGLPVTPVGKVVNPIVDKQVKQVLNIVEVDGKV